jgi:hypothetical protein
MMSGAVIGGSIGSVIPVIGTIIGAVVGAALGGIAGAIVKDPAWKQIQDRIRSSLGTAVSDGTAQAIADAAKKLGDWHTAEILNIDKIITDAGGVMANTIDKWSLALRNVFTLQGRATPAQIATAFGTSFKTISDAVVASGNIASEQFRELIRLAKEFGVVSQELKDFLSGQAERGSTALGNMLGAVMGGANVIGTGGKLTGGYSGLGGQVTEAQQAIEDWHTAQSEAQRYFEATAENRGKHYAASAQDLDQLAQLEKTLRDLQNKQKAGVAAVSGDLVTMGRIILSTFNAAVSSGMSWMDVMDKVGGALDALVAGYKDLGISLDDIDNPAVKALLHYRDLANANKDLVLGMSGLNEATLALSNLGGLDAGTLADLSSMGGSLYKKWTEAGFTDQETLMAMSPWLKTMKDAFAQAKIDIPPDLQAFIDRADEYGFMKENNPIVRAIIDGSGRIVDAIHARKNDWYNGESSPSSVGYGSTLTGAYNPNNAAALSAGIVTSGDGNLTVPVYLDGRLVGQGTVKYMSRNLSTYGIR